MGTGRGKRGRGSSLFCHCIHHEHTRQQYVSVCVDCRRNAEVDCLWFAEGG